MSDERTIAPIKIEEIGEESDGPDHGRPVNAETGEPMSDEEYEAFRQAIASGHMKFHFSEDVKKDMEQLGLTEDELLSIFHEAAGLKQ